VRLSRSRIRARVKSDLPIVFSGEKISAHGGLELFRRFLVAIGLPGRVRVLFRDTPLDGDYGAVRMMMLLVGLLVIGGLRVSHLAFVGVDPILLRFAGLHCTPSDRTVVAWLKAFTPPALERLSDLIRDLVYDQVERSRLPRLTIDLDGTVLRTGAKVDGAQRGFNPHHPKDPSYYPLTAHLAQLGQLLRIWNRPGNVHDSHNAAGFLRVLFQDLRARFGHRLPIELRMDGAFFHPAVFAFLDGERVDYALKVPMWQSLGLLPALWHFMAGRGAHEKTLAELKSQVAFAAIPTNDRYANAAWQLLSALTLNLPRSFQITTGAARRPRTLKRTFDYVFQSLATLRFELFHQPVRLARPGGRLQLRFAVSPRARSRIQHCDRAIRRLAA